MPKAAIHEQCNAFVMPDEIGPARQNRAAPPASQPVDAE
jgi:hypothetical protein